MEKIYEIELDCTGVDNVCYEINKQKEVIQQKLDDEKIDVKITGIADYTCCYGVTFRGTMENLKKMLIEFYGSDDNEINEFIEDERFDEV